ncbi:type II toxin-antitoxin system PemK/MazF family toxin [Pararoseomonas indoligenes]|uniref:type II toxin-antitoxin system PemK/MazF family toxin n=1 Tax=Roseomonas indoligenes TaxID=2820811 RepID=UPI0038D24BE2
MICNYNSGFREPEMVKERLAVVVSPRLPHRDRLCTVVPLSTTPARAGIRYQCKIMLPTPAPAPYEGTLKWAKADMLATVCYDRLTLPYTGRDPVGGKRKYLKIIVPESGMQDIRLAMLHALGMESLTSKPAEPI